MIGSLCWRSYLLRADQSFGSVHGIGQQHDYIIDRGGSPISCGCLKPSAAMPAAGAACQKDRQARSFFWFERCAVETLSSG